jgi:CDP-2,3-bis-(O-geranylgeranyl)-sn-glycerol synthase
VIGDILFAIWFFGPAGLANAAPVFASRIAALDTLNIPIDLGKHFRGKRIFGDHKTVRGFVAGVFVGIVTGVLQHLLYMNIAWVRHFSLISYESLLTSVMLGILLSFGALFGDAVKSFFKRQFSVPSGKAWFPFDQIDYIVGGLLFSSIVIDLPHSAYLWIGLIWFLIHPIATFIGWLLGLKDSPI